MTLLNSSKSRRITLILVEFALLNLTALFMGFAPALGLNILFVLWHIFSELQ